MPLDALDAAWDRVRIHVEADIHMGAVEEAVRIRAEVRSRILEVADGRMRTVEPDRHTLREAEVVEHAHWELVRHTD